MTVRGGPRCPARARRPGWKQSTSSPGSEPPNPRLEGAAARAAAGRLCRARPVLDAVSPLVSGDRDRARSDQPALAQRFADRLGRLLVRRGGRPGRRRRGAGPPVLRAEGRAFHVPAGTAAWSRLAGAWACVLDRLADVRQGGHDRPRPVRDHLRIEWGIFVALAVAGVLTYAGTGSGSPTTRAAPARRAAPAQARPRPRPRAPSRRQRGGHRAGRPDRRGRHGRHLDSG